jgi:hypothetical protein
MDTHIQRETTRVPPASVLVLHRLGVSVAIAFVVGACAINRPHVKSLRDPGADTIQFDVPIHTTVKVLNAIPAHCGPTLDHRVRREEFQVYQVTGRIVRLKVERDHDIHVVLENPDDSRDHLVAELDDPDFRGNTASPYRAKLAAARRMFDELQRQSGAHELKDLQGIVVRVTGVGFFDLNHLQVGRSRSCIELHPILAIERDQPALTGISPAEPVVAHPDESLRMVVYRMAETGLTRFPVVDRRDHALVGMIALTDLLKARALTLDAEHRRERVLGTRIAMPFGRR